MDKIHINALRIHAYHGVNPDEKEKGQPFELDITCHLPLAIPCRTDCVEDTVSYASIIKTVKRLMTEQSFDLLERTAQAVADGILDTYPSIQQADIVLKKPRAPILADFGWVGVEISRMRQQDNPTGHQSVI